MDCLQANDRLNASLDGELSSDDESALESHLAGCADCRSAADALRSLDGELRRSFAPTANAAVLVAQRAIERLEGEGETGEASGERGIVVERGIERVQRGGVRGEGSGERVRRARIPLYYWYTVALAAAAGFLLAVFLFPPWDSPARIATVLPAPPVAQLALATGPVRVVSPDGTTSTANAADQGIVSGSTVSTGPALCEFACPSDSVVRLNQESEMRFHDEGSYELTKGQLWSSVAAPGRPLEIKTANGTVIAEQAQLDMGCQSDETLIRVCSGSATVRHPSGEDRIEAGEQLRLSTGKPAERRELLDPLLATSWVHELIALKGPEDQEFAERMNDILAQIGGAKISYLYEDEIRRQGDSCVAPLVRYVESPRSADDQSRRVKAARIVADVAQPKSIPLLIDLLADANAEVRAAAAAGLMRLTGRDQGLPAESWQTLPWISCEPTYGRWLEWWNENKDRYPTPPSRTEKFMTKEKKG